jgi:hypothetical protein
MPGPPRRNPANAAPAGSALGQTRQYAEGAQPISTKEQRDAEFEAKRAEAARRGPGYGVAADIGGGYKVIVTDPEAVKRNEMLTVNTPAAPAPPVDPNPPAPAAPLTSQQRYDQAAQQLRDPTAPAAQPRAGAAPRAAPAGGARPAPANLQFTATPNNAPPTQAEGGPWQPVSQDTGRYDAEAARLRELQTTFLDQLGRLSQADPFGNQAALQKATDRAVAQAAGTAASARGGAAAQLGAQRQAVGVQAQTSARGAQDIVEQRRRDEQQATGLGLQAISGAAQVGGQLAQNEIALGDQAIRAAEVNLRGYLGGQELGQRERESLRNFALEASKIDMERYRTDMTYRAQVDQDLTQRYIANSQLQGIFAKINAEEGIGAADWLMGTVGLVSGVTGGIAMGVGSDVNMKTNIRRPSTKALREFVSRGEGYNYEYRDPKQPGARAGENFGPMAQDLQKSAIGRTLVKKGPDGRTLMVDAARLAMADHSALTHLAKRLERLEHRGARGRGGAGRRNG